MPSKRIKKRPPEYTAWANLKQRCLNPRSQKWARYGGRGITVHPDWIASFEAFFKHIGPRPSALYSVDRIDNDGNYEPGNVRWATAEQQRRSKGHRGEFVGTHFITFGGVTQNITRWSIQAGLAESTLNRRIALGWPIERALTAPVRYRSPRSA